MPPEPTHFPRRRNQDGTTDSICVRCFATVKRSTSEQELAEAERHHICDEQNLLRREFVLRWQDRN